VPPDPKEVSPLTPEEEKQWIAEAAGGDEPAFEHLARAYEKRIYSHALRMTGDAEDAFDISQEALIRLYFSLPSFKGDSSFSTYVYQITSNLCKDHFRAKKRRPVTAAPPEDEETWETFIADDRFSPEKALEQSELRDLLDRGIAALSPEHREVVVLREVHDLSYDEMADALGLDMGTIKSRLSRARGQLRIFLRREGNFHSYGTS
jgi:RNA polymerase sigma-70 factor (ECF subfamily)